MLIATCEPPPGLSPVDHDQRNTLNAGANSTLLPGHVLASLNVYYGSGFTNGEPDAQYPGAYLPSHTSVDLSLGKSFGENDAYRISVTALNLANRRVLLDNSLTFGGFHYNTRGRSTSSSAISSTIETWSFRQCVYDLCMEAGDTKRYALLLLGVALACVLAWNNSHTSR